jgi:phage anti-repressor protein
MSNIDIVSLIESNPLTKLSSTYNNKLLVKIKNSFTELQQQLFISSFYCWLNYHNTNDFIIELDNIWKWLGFGQKDTAKRLLEKYFILDKDYKCLDKIEKQKGSGGSNKEKILLNIKTFKLFCLKAGTKKSNEIHEYFIKLEELLQEIIQEENNELKLQLEELKINENNNQKKTQLLEREKILLREFATKCSIVYIIKVKQFENGKYIVKIGESRNGIQKRYTDHKKSYGDILLLDCFKVTKSNEFEKYLHHYDIIKSNRFTNLEGHEKEVELFLIGKELTYDILLQIINENIHKYNDYNETIVENIVDKLYNEIDILKSKLSNNNEIKNITIDSSILQKILDNQIQMSNQITSLEKSNKEILEKLVKTQIKTTTNFNQPLVTISHKLQQINPETKTIIKVYDTVAHCLIENKYRLKRPSIEKAISENRVYKGFFWAYVDQNKDPNIIHQEIIIKPSRPQNNGYIAKLNEEKTKIINVYLDRKTAAKLNGYNSHSALDNPVKNNTPTNNHYYILYDRCQQNVIDSFVKDKGEPILYKSGVGYFDTNNNLENEFLCKYDCIKKLKISDKTLAKVLDNNVMYNNHFFKSLPEKLYI